MKKKIMMLLAVVLCFSGCSNSSGNSELPDQSNICDPKILETENGWYFNRIYDLSAKQYLHFKDKKTGKTIPLCSKPECPHIGSPFCAAASDRHVSDMALYKDSIYIVSCTSFDMFEKTDVFDTKLYRQSLDGTERTELATVARYKGYTIVNRADITVCSDIAYITYKITNSDNYLLNVGLVMIDIKTGNIIKRFNELTAADIDPVYPVDGEGRGIYERVVPYGEYVYYSHHDDRAPRSNGYLYRYSIKTGAEEQLPVNKSFIDFCIIDGEVVFADEAEENAIGLYKLDSSTGEISPLGEPFIRNGDKLYPRGLLFDNEHIVAVNAARDECYILDKTGGLITSFSLPDVRDKSVRLAVCNIVNGKFYLSSPYTDGAYYCPMEDILAGNIHWECAYSSDDSEQEG